VALSNDGSTAYYEVFDQMCDGPSLREISVSSGESKVFAQYGNSPAVSPDGNKVAFNASAGCDVGSQLAVKTLASGNTNYFAGNSDEVSDSRTVTSAPGTIAWMDNSRIVVDVITYPTTATNPIDGLHVYDVSATNRPYSSGKPLAVSDAKAGTYYNAVSRMSDGKLFAVQACCDASNDLQRGVTSSARMIIIDPASGNVLKVVATGFPDRSYSSTRSDNSSANLLYLSNDDLRISSNGANPEVLISGVSSADWK
jgi:hypothetical protein